MHRAIDDVQVLLTQNHILVDHCFLHSLQVVPVHLTTDDFNEFLVAFELHVVDGYLVHFINDALIVRSQHLCAIIPISLVAVILLRVVAGGENDTAIGMMVDDRHLNGGSGGEPKVDDVHAERLQSTANQLVNHFARNARIATDHNR